MIYPLAIVILTTLVVGFVAVKARVSAIRTKQLDPEYLKLMQGGSPPEAVIKTTRCFNNLFEVPVLFYTASVLYISSSLDSILILVLAWCFVLARIAQAYIHITYNNVRHRMLAFFTSFISVTAMWGVIVANKI